VQSYFERETVTEKSVTVSTPQVTETLNSKRDTWSLELQQVPGRRATVTVHRRPQKGRMEGSLWTSG
jgi:hypothetical protein